MINLKNKGFTLVELIIVVAVIAILATVLAPQYIRYVERARQSNDLQVATNIMRAAAIAVADPQNDVPADTEIYVVWETDEEQPTLKGQLSVDTIVNLPNPGNPAFEVNLMDAIGGGVGGTPNPNFDPNLPIDWTTNRYYWDIDLPQSATASTLDFKFSINSSTGNITYYEDTDPMDTDTELDNYAWITDIGVQR